MNATMPNRSPRGRQQRRRTKYMWSGIQSSSPTNIPIAGLASVLVSEAFVRTHGNLTVVRIRGDITMQNGGSDAAAGDVGVAYKILVVNQNDAGAISDDVQALDSDIEDISRRILDQAFARLGSTSSVLPSERRLEIDVKVSVKVIVKQELVCLFDASVVNRGQAHTNLRALCIIS